MLKRTVSLEHGVEMPDQQHTRANAAALRHEMTGAPERCAIHPARRKANRVILGTQQPADLAHSGNILCAAVHVHKSLQQRHRFGIARRRVRLERTLDL